ncbi:MAG: hypothetical protein RLZZ399_2234 [Verrucomicrobiota bacterium]|jgi:ADP-heptose:LPS heptosyltransferase
MRVLVLQLERLGDVIQSTPALRELEVLKACETVLWVNAEWAPALEGLPGIQVRTCPGETVTRLNREFGHASKQQPPPPAATHTLEQMGLGKFDAVLNLTHGNFAAWAASQLTEGPVFGRYLDSAGEWLYGGRWLALLPSIVDFRELHSLNLVDIYRGAARELVRHLAPGQGHLPLPGPQSRPWVARTPSPSAGAHLPSDKPIVALNPGASAPERQWPPSAFADLSDQLTERGFCPVLVGSLSDTALCQKVVELARLPPLNRCGKTSVPEFAALVAQAELLVSNDTGAVHVAAAVGTPVLGLYGAAASFRETAPWGEGHLVIQLPPGTPMEQIPATAVFLAASAFLKTTPWREVAEICKDEGLSAWQTFFLNPEADPLGGLAYRPLHDLPGSQEEMFLLCLRHAFAFEFAGEASAICHGDLGNRTFSAAPEERATLEETLQQLRRLLLPLIAHASACTDFLRLGDLRSLQQQVATLESELATLSDALRESPPSAPVLSNLLWELRFLPRSSPGEIFEGYQRALVRADSIMAQAESLWRRVSC